MPSTNTATQQARVMFLNKIRQRLAEESRPLSGLAMEYWNALEPEDEVMLDHLWENKKLGAQLEPIEKEFEAALRNAIEQDLLNDGAAKESYLDAMEQIKSLAGVQLQAIVFAATLSVPAIANAEPTDPFAWVAIGFVLLVAVVIGLVVHYHR